MIVSLFYPVTVKVFAHVISSHSQSIIVVLLHIHIYYALITERILILLFSHYCIDLCFDESW